MAKAAQDQASSQAGFRRWRLAAFVDTGKVVQTWLENLSYLSLIHISEPTRPY